MITIEESVLRNLLMKEKELDWVKEYAIYNSNIWNLDKKVSDYILKQSKKFPSKVTPEDYADQELKKFIDGNQEQS